MKGVQANGQLDENDLDDAVSVLCAHPLRGGVRTFDLCAGSESS